MTSPSAVDQRTSFRGLWLLGAGLLAVRFLHLTGPLDDPHSWRQCDTVGYSLDFYRRGVDLLHPAVCWLGAHRTLIFELALPEAISAMLYRVFGPSAVWDRVVALGFFVIASLYFHALVRRVAGRRSAALATVAWLALPLGQFFSRAAHVDFAATAFAHALLYHAWVALERRSPAHAALAGAAGALAAMIKAPYLLPILPPLALVALAAPLAAMVWMGAPLALSAVAFAIWRRHVDAVNAAAPDWDFLPGYYKEVNPLWWYFGGASERFDTASWIKLARRLLFEVATPLGALLAIAGLAPRATRSHAGGGRVGAEAGPGARAFALAWSLGVLGYLLVFFPLNVIHDYYQIPFLAPAALWIGLGMDALWERAPQVGPVRAAALALAAFALLAVWAPRRLGYYRVDWLRVEAGRMIDARLPRGELLIVADHNSGYSDPRLLRRADREGWALAIADLTPDRLRTLAGLGARWAAVVTSPEHPGLAPPPSLAWARIAELPIVHAGHPIGTLGLYDLDRPGPRPPGGSTP